jgi:hypothetical protein
VTNWGNFGVVGPVSVHPDVWDRGVGKALMDAVVVRAGLFTFPHSGKHLGFYQKFGFWPRSLTPILSRDIPATTKQAEGLRFSALGAAERGDALRACSELTGALCEGLALDTEIQSVDAQRLGDSILCWRRSRLEAFAVCHAGTGSEGRRRHLLRQVRRDAAWR